MKRKLTLPAFALAMMVGLSGCDLKVTNPNVADRERALASPDDVETLIASSFQNYWGVTHYYRSNTMALNHMSSRHTATWGNFGMNDLGREPREPYPNSPAYNYSYVFEVPWQDNYGAISAATSGIQALDAGLEIGDGGERNARARTWATFVQGLSSCNLALNYDRAFVLDETVDLGGELEPIDHHAMLTYALGKLDEAEALARANSFTLPDTWLPGNGGATNTQLADMIVSYKARCRANEPRTTAEAATVNWSQVASDAAAGAEVVVFGAGTQDNWWDGMKVYGTENGTWHRLHMDWAGMGDVSGEYQDWLTFPTEQRTARDMQFVDQRYPANNVDGEEGLYHRYNSTIIFRPERGTYRQSHYGDFRYDTYRLSCGGCWTGDMVEVTDRELRLYQAEAAFRQGNIATTVSIVNETRVANGGLPPVVDGGTVPGGADCTPRKRYDVQGRCGTLEDALIWEHFEEVFWVSGGLEFWHGRRFGILPAGTGLDFPIPASDLEVLQRDIYTWGGNPDDPTGTNSADYPRCHPQSSVACSVIPRPGVLTLDDAIWRASEVLDYQQRRAKEIQRTVNSGLIIR